MAQLRRYNKITIGKIFRFIKFSLLGVKFKGFVHIEKGAKILRFKNNIIIQKNVILKENSKICGCNPKAKILIGENTTIGYNTLIFASESIEIGDDCLVAPNVHLVDSNHKIDKKTRINLQENITAAINIQEDVWIGSGSTITMGVKVGKGSVIAAGSVLTKSTNPYEVWGGVPSKFIKFRE